MKKLFIMIALLAVAACSSMGTHQSSAGSMGSASASGSEYDYTRNTIDAIRGTPPAP